MVNRKGIPLTSNNRLRQVILDTPAAQFPAEATELALRIVGTAQCIGRKKGVLFPWIAI